MFSGQLFRIIEKCLFFAILKIIFTIDFMRRKQIKQPSDAPFLGLYRVSRFYRNDRSALFDISFGVNSGEFIYITGTSGAGKSTLIRIMGALDMPDTGTVLFNGHDIRTLKKTAIALLRRNIGVVFQDFKLVPDMTIQSNISLPLEVAGWSRAAIRARVEEVLEKVGLFESINERAGDLSGGEQQRIAIARAIAPNPEVILADEPTGNLDAYNANFVLDLFEQVNADGTTIILATHDRMLMSARPHRTITLEKGHLTGMTPEMYSSSKLPVASPIRSTG